MELETVPLTLTLSLQGRENKAIIAFYFLKECRFASEDFMTVEFAGMMGTMGQLS